MLFEKNKQKNSQQSDLKVFAGKTQDELFIKMESKGSTSIVVIICLTIIILFVAWNFLPVLNLVE